MKATEYLAVTWLEGDAAGSIDHLPFSLFRQTGKALARKHRSSTRTWTGWAWFDLEVDLLTAVLNYSVYPKRNRKNGILPGELRITFTGSSRTSIHSYEWRDTSKQQFETIEVEVSEVRPADLPPYKPTNARGKRQARRVKERPGQIAFKRQLSIAYGGQCCITGCSVDEALDGAHIDSYQNPSHDHPSNGLLLRKDLHALFDAGLLSIDPATGLPHFKRSCLGTPEYSHLHAGAKLSQPIHAFASYAPNPSALQRHWSRFKRSATD